MLHIAPNSQDAHLSTAMHYPKGLPMSARRPVRPPFDPELAFIVDGIRGALGAFDAESLPRLRAILAQGVPGAPEVDLTAGGAVTVEELSVPGPHGAPEITLLILKPADRAGPWPAIYHTHGGGMVAGDRRTAVDTFLPYVIGIGAVVVSVEYRLAPEHPDPAPIEDCYAGLTWTADHATELGVEPGRILIAGSSAGGGLAAGTALLARDRGYPTLTHQVLMSPMLDDRLETVSSQMLDGEGIWDRNDNLFGWKSLLGDRQGGDDVSIYAAPARATDLSGLPRSYIDVGSVETFRDEAIIYAPRLTGAGVSVDLHLWGGGVHDFDAVAPHAAITRAAAATRHEFLRRALDG